MIRIVNDEEISTVNNMTNYKLINNPFSKCLVYLKDNEIIAFLDYSIIYEKVEINYIFVNNMYRKCHIGSELLEYVISENSTLENITLEVDVENYPAINLYKKHDFKEVAIRKNYYNNHDAYLMERRLP